MTTAHVATLKPVLDVIERRLGLRCDGARAPIVTDAIAAQMRSFGLRDPQAYVRHLGQDPAASDALAEALRVPETYFLREPAQLQLLGQRVLPELAGAHRERPLRLWSAGCASGEEAYSLAMVSERAGLAERVQILATDRSEAAMAAARRGTYGQRSLRNTTAADRTRWFTTEGEGGGAVVADRLRRTITFRAHDLVKDPYPLDQDLIVCRNVLLYLTDAQGAAVVRRLAASLAPGGWLVLGSADPHHQATALLEQVRGRAGSLYRRCEEPSVRPVPCRRGSPKPRNRSAPRPVPAAAGARVPRRERGSATGRDDQPIPALVRCEQDLAARPLEAELHARHAMLLLEAGQPVRARRAATAALFLSPELTAAQVLLGQAHLALRELPRAARAFEQALDLLGQLPARASVSPTGVSAGRLLTVVEAAQRQVRQWRAP